MDRLDAMQVLLAVVDGGSLSAGGRKLNVSLPSVSRRLGELEYRLGTRLLIRTTRNIQLTDAGRNYVDAIRPIVAQLEDAERRASGEYDEPRGELTVTVPSGSTRLVTVPLIFEFLEQHPKISVNLIAADRSINFIEERVDVGLHVGELADSSLYAVKFGQGLVWTLASPDYLERRGHPAHPADLSSHDGIFWDSILTPLWTYSVDGEQREYCPQFRVRANAVSNCIGAALDGLGILRSTPHIIANELRSGTLVRILDDYECMWVAYHLVYVKQDPMPLKVRAFLDWMTPRLRQKTSSQSFRDPRLGSG